jgi:DNA-binding XRE family transcriptional regulator
MKPLPTKLTLEAHQKMFKYMRAKNKFTQRDLAAWLGVSQNTVYTIEKGIKPSNIKHLLKMAASMNMEIVDFMNAARNNL